MGDQKKVIMVTGGSGLVGHGIRAAIDKEGKRGDEEWVFVSSKDADLRCVFIYVGVGVHWQESKLRDEKNELYKYVFVFYELFGMT